MNPLRLFARLRDAALGRADADSPPPGVPPGVRLGPVAEAGRHVRSCLASLDGVPAELQYYAGPGYLPETRVILAWNRPAAFRVASGTAALVERRTFPEQGWLYTGDREFDEAFVALGRPREFALDFLDYVTRQRLLDLADLAREPDARHGARVETYAVGSGFSNLMVGVQRPLEDQEDHRIAFLTQAMALARRLWVEPGKPLPIVAATEDAADGRCPVCGEDLAGELRRCETCRTLHHEECWTYNEGCATYACPSRERAPLPPPAEAGATTRFGFPATTVEMETLAEEADEPPTQPLEPPRDTDPDQM